MNGFAKDYKREQANRKAYREASEAGNQQGIEAARAAHKALSEEISSKGPIYTKLFNEYERSRDSGNALLDLNEVIWDREIPDMIACMKENDIIEFTLSSTWSGAIDAAWAFNSNGYHLNGMVDVNSRFKDFLTDEYETMHAFHFSLC